MFGLAEKSYLAAISEISRISKIEKVVIFGSRAKGNFRAGSDVDLALFGKGLQREDLRKISQILNDETSLPYHFDFLIFDDLRNRELREHILRVGKIFYERS